MKYFRYLFSFSPFKAGFLVVVAACCLFLWFGDRKPELLSSLDSRGIDSMFRWRGAIPTTQQVVVVDIDEKSLNALGQWPWPRDQVARLVQLIGQAGAKVIGFDVVFAEADRTSPSRLLAQIAEDVPGSVDEAALAGLHHDARFNHDQILGAALGRIPAVLGYVFLLQNDQLKDPFQVPFPSVNLRSSPGGVPFATLNLMSAYRAIINVPDVSTATSEGFFNFFPDASGMVRKSPLMMALDGIPYPSLAFEMFRIGLGEDDAVLHVSQRVATPRKGILGVEVGSQFLPTDDQAQLTINYRGAVGTFRYVSALDVLQQHQLNVLKDKYVLIGTTAAGLHDLRSTPFSTIFPGVEIQATIIDNCLAGDPLTYDAFTERGVTFVLVLVGGVLLSALLAYTSPLVGGLSSLLLIAAVVVGNYWLFFLNNQIVGMTYPLLVLLTIFPVVSVLNYFYEGREKRFVSMAFGRYVSPQVVAQLRKNPQHLALSGQEREMTILFSDIRGFTSISEKMSADQLGRFMNRYLTAMSQTILNHGGTVDKFIGDAVMAIWNAPLQDADHARHGVEAALAMQQVLSRLRLEWQAEGLPTLKIGVGINTGVVSVGNFGSAERFDYTVIGDHVNLASRLEGLTKFYGVPILISEHTRRQLGDAIVCRQIDRVRVKGKTEAVAIYEPLAQEVLETAFLEEIDLFHAAQQDYAAGRFSAACQRFELLCREKPQKLYEIYLQRSIVGLEQPLPDDWDGVFTLHRK